MRKRSIAGRNQFIEVNDLAEARRFGEQWNELAARSAFPNIYATWDFVEAWWLAYGSKRKLRIWFACSDGGKLRFVAPFYVDSDRPRILNMIGNRRADYCQLVFGAGDVEMPRGWLAHMSSHSDWDSIVIERFPAKAVSGLWNHWYGPRSGWQQKVRAWMSIREPLIWISRDSTHPFISRERFSEFGGMLQQQNHRKHMNWFARQGKVEFKSVTNQAEILQALPTLFDLHLKEWSSRGEVSMFQAPTNRRFYELLTERFASLSAVSLDMMLIDGRVIAVHFGFEWGRRFYYLKPGFDPEFSSHSPGKLLLASLLQSMGTRQVDVFDFLSGLEPYKLKYTAEIGETCGTVITRSRMRRLISSFLDRRKASAPVPFE